MFDAASLRHLSPIWAYAAIVGATFLEGETLVIIAGALAHQGYMRLSLIIPCAFFGSVASDQLMFALGRRCGKPFLEARPALHARAMRATRLIEGHETLLIFGFRFLYGLRNVVPLLLGVRGVDPKKFLFLNVLGAAVWAVAFSVAGYAAGQALASFLDATSRFHNLFLVAAGALLLAWGLLRLWQHYRRRPPAP